MSSPFVRQPNWKGDAEAIISPMLASEIKFGSRGWIELEHPFKMGCFLSAACLKLRAQHSRMLEKLHEATGGQYLSQASMSTAVQTVNATNPKWLNIAKEVQDAITYETAQHLRVLHNIHGRWVAVT